MKKILLLSAIAISSAAASAQDYNLNVNLKDGTSVQYELSAIKDLTFTPIKMGPVKVTYPFLSAYEKTCVYKVMVDGKQIAEIDYEYLKGTAQKKRLAVMYLCGDDGKADLTKGKAADGLSVKWDLDANTYTAETGYGNGNGYMYIVDGEIQAAYDGDEDVIEATLEPDVITDVRGSETETYSIVKIGTQYWMAENLRATSYTNGTALEAIEATEAETWAANTTGAYIANTDPSKKGYLYNGYCVTSDKGFAPAGWEIPTKAQFNTLKTYIGTTIKLYNSAVSGSWAAGCTATSATTNSGFEAYATGQFNGTSLDQPTKKTGFWGTATDDSTVTTFQYDGTLTRLTATSITTRTLSQNYGYAIRCIRK